MAKQTKTKDKAWRNLKKQRVGEGDAWETDFDKKVKQKDIKKWETYKQWKKDKDEREQSEEESKKKEAENEEEKKTEEPPKVRQVDLYVTVPDQLGEIYIPVSKSDVAAKHQWRQTMGLAQDGTVKWDHYRNTQEPDRNGWKYKYYKTVKVEEKEERWT